MDHGFLLSFYQIFFLSFEKIQQFVSFRLELGFQNGIGFQVGFQVPIKFIFLSDCNWDLNLWIKENKDSLWLVYTSQNVTALALGRAFLGSKLKSMWALATPAFREKKGVQSQV